MRRVKFYKKAGCFLLVFALSAALLTGCGEKNTAYDGTDLGKLSERNCDIMGVRYNLYSKGYAEIEFLLNAYGELTDTVTYEGKEYKVVKIASHHAGPGVDYGIFDNNGTYESPENLTLPSTIEEIPYYAFKGCKSSTITLPPNVKRIAGGAFFGCENIETVVFPPSLEKLSAYHLFSGCSSLKQVDLPDNVEYELDTSYLFAACTSLESAYIPGVCGGGMLGERTFSDCEALTDIRLGDGLTIVWGHAFHNLPLLEEIVFPDSITEIKDQTFFDCPNLKDVWLSDNLSDVPAHMFKQSYGQYDADTSGLTIHVKESLVDYVQNLYPDAAVIAK